MKELDMFYNTLDNEQLLYHYTSFETAGAYILPSGSLQLSPLGKSKDAIESINYFDSLPKSLGNVEDISEQINYEISNYIKILCFSKDSNIEKHNKPGMMLARMWSQYGENHRGLCLVFSKEKLKKCFEKKFKDKQGKLVEDVIYNMIPFDMSRNELGASISISNQEDQLHIVANKFPELLNNFTIKKILLSKMSDFKDENEYRFICYDNSENPYIYFPFEDALKAIVLGFNTSIEQEEIIKKISKNFNNNEPILIFKEVIKSRQSISLLNIHNPNNPPYIGLNLIQ